MSSIGGGIGINPEDVQNVAMQCRSIQESLGSQVTALKQQLSRLENSLTGPAAEKFKGQFATWQNMVNQMAETLGASSSTLGQISTSADEMIAALKRFGG